MSTIIFQTTLVAICCLAWTAKARPGIGHIGLVGIPDLDTYAGIQYPKYDILDLGEYSKGQVPGPQIHETKHITVKEPQPYPVQVPVPQPYPVHIPKPYPVVETKLVKVPHPVPVEVVKKIPIPIEVPKPYPVSQGNGGDWDLHGAGSGQSFGVQAAFGGNLGKRELTS